MEITRAWQLYRRLHDELEAAGWDLCFAVPPDEHTPAFDRFRVRVEGAVRDFQRGYFDEVANPPDRPDARPGGPDERST